MLRLLRYEVVNDWLKTQRTPLSPSAGRRVSRSRLRAHIRAEIERLEDLPVLIGDEARLWEGLQELLGLMEKPPR